MDEDSDPAPQMSRDDELHTIETKTNHRVIQGEVPPDQSGLQTAETCESEDVGSEVHESTRKEPDIEETLFEGYRGGVIYNISPRLTDKFLQIKRAQSCACCGSFFSITDKYAVNGLCNLTGRSSMWAIWPWPYKNRGGFDRVVMISSWRNKRQYLAIRNSELCLLYTKKNIYSKRQPEGTLFHLQKVEDTSADKQMITLESVSEPGSFVAFNEGEPCHPRTQNKLARQLNLKFLISYASYQRWRD